MLTEEDHEENDANVADEERTDTKLFNHWCCGLERIFLIGFVSSDNGQPLEFQRTRLQKQSLQPSWAPMVIRCACPTTWPGKNQIFLNFATFQKDANLAGCEIPFATRCG